MMTDNFETSRTEYQQINKNLNRPRYMSDILNTGFFSKYMNSSFVEFQESINLHEKLPRTTLCDWFRFRTQFASIISCGYFVSKQTKLEIKKPKFETGATLTQLLEMNNVDLDYAFKCFRSKNNLERLYKENPYLITLLIYALSPRFESPERKNAFEGIKMTLSNYYNNIDTAPPKLRGNDLKKHIIDLYETFKDVDYSSDKLAEHLTCGASYVRRTVAEYKKDPEGYLMKLEG